MTTTSNANRELGAAGDVRAHAVQQAIDIAGSALVLCTYLGISPERLLSWIANSEEVPQPYFLKLVDVICDDLDALDRKALAAARRVAGATSADGSSPSAL